MNLVQIRVRIPAPPLQPLGIHGDPIRYSQATDRHLDNSDTAQSSGSRGSDKRLATPLARLLLTARNKKDTL